MTADRVQVGLPEDANTKLVQLREDTPYFGEEADVYRLAVSVALAMRAPVSDSLKETSTKVKYRITQGEGEEELPRLDTPDRRLAIMVELFHPEAIGQPYRFSQYLATIGINYMYRELIERGRTLSQALAEIDAAGASQRQLNDETPREISDDGVSADD